MNSQPYRVLVAHDEPAVVWSLSNFLKLVGYEVLQAGSGPQALTAMEYYRPQFVIAGWEMGFEGMKVGGKRRLFLPYQLAYGEKGRGSIPPKAELVFDVELLDVKDVLVVLAAADVLLPYENLEKQVLQLAGAIPEEKYSWRPAPRAPAGLSTAAS